MGSFSLHGADLACGPWRQGKGLHVKCAELVLVCRPTRHRFSLKGGAWLGLRAAARASRVWKALRGAGLGKLVGGTSALTQRPGQQGLPP